MYQVIKSFKSFKSSRWLSNTKTITEESNLEQKIIVSNYDYSENYIEFLDILESIDGINKHPLINILESGKLYPDLTMSCILIYNKFKRNDLCDWILLNKESMYEISSILEYYYKDINHEFINWLILLDNNDILILYFTSFSLSIDCLKFLLKNINVEMKTTLISIIEQNPEFIELLEENEDDQIKIIKMGIQLYQSKSEDILNCIIKNMKLKTFDIVNNLSRFWTIKLMKNYIIINKYQALYTVKVANSITITYELTIPFINTELETLKHDGFDIGYDILISDIDDSILNVCIYDDFNGINYTLMNQQYFKIKPNKIYYITFVTKPNSQILLNKNNNLSPELSFNEILSIYSEPFQSIPNIPFILNYNCIITF